MSSQETSDMDYGDLRRRVSNTIAAFGVSVPDITRNKIATLLYVDPIMRESGDTLRELAPIMNQQRKAAKQLCGAVEPVIRIMESLVDAGMPADIGRRWAASRSAESKPPKQMAEIFSSSNQPLWILYAQICNALHAKGMTAEQMLAGLTAIKAGAEKTINDAAPCIQNTIGAPKNANPRCALDIWELLRKSGIRNQTKAAKIISQLYNPIQTAEEFEASWEAIRLRIQRHNASR